jgi:hypothetical protein
MRMRMSRFANDVERIGISAHGVALLCVLSIEQKLSTKVTGGRGVDSAFGVGN